MTTNLFTWPSAMVGLGLSGVFAAAQLIANANEINIDRGCFGASYREIDYYSLSVPVFGLIVCLLYLYKFEEADPRTKVGCDAQ